ncbi:MAG TPA: hypothetical protein P5136_07445 [Methanofastidiosum sp.]|nr:hypothetical protein [Methanofastidiosum sp.]
MKVSASKRVLFIIIFLFILLLGGVAYYFKDVISNGIKYGRWFTVDKYEELFDYCDWERKGKDLNIKCKALLRSMSVPKDNKDGICYEYLVYHKKYPENVKEFKLCEDPKSIYYENKDKSITLKLKIDLAISFDGELLNYSYKKIEMLNITESK